MGCNTGLSQTKPQAGVGMVDLHHLHEGVEGCQRLACIELLETQVVEEDVPVVHPQDREGPTREGCGWGVIPRSKLPVANIML